MNAVATVFRRYLWIPLQLMHLVGHFTVAQSLPLIWSLF